MNSTLIYLCIAILMLCTILISYGMIRYDTAIIRFERASKKFPYAKWKQVKPLLHVYIVGRQKLEIEQTLQSLKKSSYRKKIVTSSSHIPHDVRYPCLVVRAGDTFDRDAIKQAVQLSQFQAASTVDVTPRLKPLKTVNDTFANYAALLAIPFKKTIQGLHIGRYSFSRNVLYATQPKTRGIAPTAYLFTQITLRAIISLSIIAITYLAIAASQPQLLLTALLACMSFAVVIIWIESPLNTASKFLYTLLVPAILPYFYAVGLVCFLTFLYTNARSMWRVKTSREYVNS